MRVEIDQKVLECFENTHIGVLIAEVSVKESDPFVEELKLSLRDHVQESGIHANNFMIHPSISVWRGIYEEHFGVRSKKFRSSLEALVKRIAKGERMWNINSVVDLYNCCSVLSLLPMGGYDLDRVCGDVTIRFGRDGELFFPLGSTEGVPVSERQVVYADDEGVCCWLWNHKDAERTCIDASTKRVVFFIDSFNGEALERSMKLLSTLLEKVGAAVLERTVLSKKRPAYSFVMPSLSF